MTHQIACAAFVPAKIKYYQQLRYGSFSKLMYDHDAKCSNLTFYWKWIAKNRRNSVTAYRKVKINSRNGFLDFEWIARVTPLGDCWTIGILSKDEKESVVTLLLVHSLSVCNILHHGFPPHTPTDLVK